MTGSLQRISAMLMRHFYILRGSKVRLIEVTFWPAVNMILWGFVSRFFAFKDLSTLDYALATILGAVLLWDTLFRIQIGITISYLEEIWARNLGHLFVSPLRPYEWWISMTIFGVFRALLGVLPAVLCAIPFYGFSIFDLGLPLLFFFLNLMFMACWLGFLVMSVLIKAGPGAESFAWMTAFALAPFCAVYYPVEVLPHWMQVIANGMPAAQVFEGLRALVQKGIFETHYLWRAFGLNCVYMAISILLLQLCFEDARKKGSLLQTGE